MPYRLAKDMPNLFAYLKYPGMDYEQIRSTGVNKKATHSYVLPFYKDEKPNL
jgi:hypothetical protein